MTLQVVERDGEIKADDDDVRSSWWYSVVDEVFDHPIVGANAQVPKPVDPERPAWAPFIAWQWFIKEAARRDRIRTLKDKAIPLVRGQLVASLRYLAKLFNWSFKTVRRWLDRLRRHRMIELSVVRGTQMVLDLAGSRLSDVCPERGTGITVITLCNYAKYQKPLGGKGTGRAQQGHSRGTAGAQSQTENIDTEKKKKESCSRSTRLPADWVLPQEWRQWAEINFSADASLITAEADRFRDYWIAQPGTKGRKLDWAATWRNWCRNARGHPATVVRRGATIHSLPTKPTDIEAKRRFEESLARAREELQAEEAQRCRA